MAEWWVLCPPRAQSQRHPAVHLHSASSGNLVPWGWCVRQWIWSLGWWAGPHVREDRMILRRHRRNATPSAS